MITILGPADDSAPMIEVGSELMKVHHVDRHGVWMQHRTADGSWSNPIHAQGSEKIWDIPPRHPRRQRRANLRPRGNR